jgi:hypothetical protein
LYHGVPLSDDNEPVQGKSRLLYYKQYNHNYVPLVESDNPLSSKKIIPESSGESSIEHNYTPPINTLPDYKAPKNSDQVSQAPSLNGLFKDTTIHVRSNLSNKDTSSKNKFMEDIEREISGDWISSKY